MRFCISVIICLFCGISFADDELWYFKPDGYYKAEPEPVAPEPVAPDPVAPDPEIGYFKREGYQVDDEFPRDNPDSIIIRMNEKGDEIRIDRKLYRERKFEEDLQKAQELIKVLRNALN